MGYKKKIELAAEKAITLGGKGQDGRPNPTSIEGYYLGAKTVDSDFGPGKLHIFQTEKGNVGVWGKSHLNGLLTSELAGTMVLVTFEGMKQPSKKGRKPSYSYSVQYDEENTIDVSGIITSSGNDAEDDSEPTEDDFRADTSSNDDEDAEYEEPVETSKTVSRPAKAANVTADRKARIDALLSSKK